jgi:molybdate transport system regulatory protein
MSRELLKIRIANGRSIAMGPGKADLLEAIDACGSISSAAKQMQMSYRRAWELVDVMNKCFKQPLVISSPGGQHGGGAHLTEFGYFILKNYRDLVAKTCIAVSAELDHIASNLKLPD